MEIATCEPRGDAAGRVITAVIDVGHSIRVAAAAWFQKLVGIRDPAWFASYVRAR